MRNKRKEVSEGEGGGREEEENKLGMRRGRKD